MTTQVIDAQIKLSIEVYDDQDELDATVAALQADTFIEQRKAEMGADWEFLDTERLNYNRVRVIYTR